MRRWLALGAVAVVLSAAFAAWLDAQAHAAGRTPELGLTLALAVLMGACTTGLGVLLAMGVRGVLVGMPTVELAEGERVLGSIEANHFRGAEARGGRLFVTDRGLHFTPHRFNFALATVSVPFAEVERLRAGGAMLDVYTRAGVHVFVVPRSEQLMEQLAAVALASPEARAATAGPFAWRREDGERRRLTA